MQAEPEHRPQFRLVELAVVIATILILAGMILPGLQRVRETEGRTQCINNNKQIGLGVHNYASAYQGRLPALASDAAEKKHGDFNCGILVALMPFVESNPTFNHALVLPNCLWYAPVHPNSIPPFSTIPPGVNGPPLSSLLWKVYQCPADATIVKGMSANQDCQQTSVTPYYFPWAASSYSANYQVFGTENDLGSLKSGNYCGPKYDLEKIPDGAANTVFFAEQFAACGRSAGNLWAYPGIGNYSGTQYTSTMPGDHVPTGMDGSIVNEPGTTNGYLWTAVFANNNSTYGFTAGGIGGSVYQYNRRRPAAPELAEPDAAGMCWDATPQTGISREECDKSRVQSFHTNTVMVLMGDGSARTVAGSIGQATWHSAIVPDDGVALGTDW